MNKFVFSTILVLTSLACRPMKKADSETESVVMNGNKWANIKSVPVCVMNRGEISDRLFNDVKNHVSNEYASKVGINIVGWGNCAAADQQRRIVRVRFNRVHDWSNSRGVSAGGGLSMLGSVPNSCGSSCAGGTMRLDIGRTGDYPSFTGNMLDFAMTQTRSTAVHEFGHALGLAHEHERTDAPNCNDIATKVRNGGAYVYVGQYDPNSIMNYCSNNKIAVLSAGDVAGLKFLYPVLGGGSPTPQPGTPNNGGGNPNGGTKPTNIPENSYYIMARHSSLCVDIDRSSLADGGNVQQWDCNRTSAQIFQLVAGGGGSFFIRNINSNKCVDVEAFSQNNLANVSQYSCTGTPNQRVYLTPTSGGFYRIQFAHSNKCLDVLGAGKTAGANINQYDCLNAPNQEFGFIRATR